MNSWAFCERYRVENLLVKVLARKHLKFVDILATIVIMGDVGGWMYLHNANCEETLHSKQGMGGHVEGRQVNSLDYGTQMS